MRFSALAISLTASALLAACGHHHHSHGAWTSVIAGTQGLANFDTIGQANWSGAGSGAEAAIVANAGGKDGGYLMTKASYKDFHIRAEFWASDDANSGIFLRCQDRSKVTADNCYEANIFDQRPDPTYGTGAIVNIAKVIPMPRAGGKWNTYEITAKGDHLVLILNGQKTVDVRDSKFASGPFALQWTQGVIKFRKLEIKAL